MADSIWLEAVITIGFGAAAGGITNWIAVLMLFHPYEPWRLGLLTLQGAIPKNKARLAKSIGRTVGQRLLTEEDLARQLAAPGLREAFDRALGKKLCVDIPSGLHGDTGAVLGACCHGDVTVTFVGPKTGMTTPNGAVHCGRIVVVGLGLPESDSRAAASQ